MQLIYRQNKYIAVTKYEERAIPKEARFQWSPNNKYWWTDNKECAQKLIKYADTETKKILTGTQDAQSFAIEQSRKTSSNINIPCPKNLHYLPYQKAGIAFALDRQNVLIGDEMGLGKTIQAIGIINSINCLPCIITPQLAKRN